MLRHVGTCPTNHLLTIFQSEIREKRFHNFADIPSRILKINYPKAVIVIYFYRTNAKRLCIFSSSRWTFKRGNFCINFTWILINCYLIATSRLFFTFKFNSFTMFGVEKACRRPTPYKSKTWTWRQIFGKELLQRCQTQPNELTLQEISAS